MDQSLRLLLSCKQNTATKNISFSNPVSCSHMMFMPFVPRVCCYVQLCSGHYRARQWPHQNEVVHIYRVSQEEWTKLWESVPYVKLYRYNPKHLYPKLKGYGDNGQRSLKLWQLLLTYWLPNTYWNWQEYVVSVMIISVLNIKLTCEWHKSIKLNYKNTRTTVVFVLRFPSTFAGRSWPLSCDVRATVL